MSAPLFFLPNAQPLSDIGQIQPGCYFRFYRSETNDLEDIYADGDLTTPLANPLASDDAGRFPAIYLDARIPYRVQLLSAANVLLSDVDPYFPVAGSFVGEIKLYAGDIDDVPAGWVNCDGTNGTPDMRDSFPIGVSNTKAVRSTGGGSGFSGSTGSAGAHSHGGNTGGHSLTEAELATHSHAELTFPATGDDNSQLPITMIGGSDQQSLGPITISDTETGEAGEGDAHLHTISSDGAHTHTVTGDIDPPYVALYFLMFTG